MEEEDERLMHYLLHSFDVEKEYFARFPGSENGEIGRQLQRMQSGVTDVVGAVTAISALLRVRDNPQGLTHSFLHGLLENTIQALTMTRDRLRRENPV